MNDGLVLFLKFELGFSWSLLLSHKKVVVVLSLFLSILCVIRSPFDQVAWWNTDPHFFVNRFSTEVVSTSGLQ